MRSPRVRSPPSIPPAFLESNLAFFALIFGWTSSNGHWILIRRNLPDLSPQKIIAPGVRISTSLPKARAYWIFQNCRGRVASTPPQIFVRTFCLDQSIQISPKVSACPSCRHRGNLCRNVAELFPFSQKWIPAKIIDRNANGFYVRFRLNRDVIPLWI